MLDLDDKRWSGLKGACRTLFDPRTQLIELEAGRNTSKTWEELWDELHHQGDVGEASYAAVPHLVRIYGQSRVIDWNTYAIVMTIELTRGVGENPDVPDWLAEDYFHAIQELAQIGISELASAKEQEDIRAILSVIAIWKGLRTHGKLLINYSEGELSDFESSASDR